jgi:hypothetical protein
MSHKLKTVPLSIVSILGLFKEAWNSVMTIQNSPLRHIQRLDPMAAHAVFQILAYMWSAIFALWIGNIFWFAISGMGHSLVIGGIFITAMVYKGAEKNFKINPTDNVTSGRMFGGEHD